MLPANFHKQTIIEISQGVCLATTIESFLIDRKAADVDHPTRGDYDKIKPQCLRDILEWSSAGSGVGFRKTEWAQLRSVNP